VTPRDERGSMAVEIVILTPVLMMFVMLIVSGGRYVAVQGDIQATARDAVRAASLERDAASARAAAGQVIGQSLDADTTCSGFSLSGFAPGGTARVDLNCSVSYAGLGLIGLPGSVGVDAASSAPIDVYRRTG
jgi:Flp pilus assembly protein TadG